MTSVKLLGQQFSNTLLSLYISLYSNKTLSLHIPVSKPPYTSRAYIQDDRPTSPIAVTIKVRPIVSRYSHQHLRYTSATFRKHFGTRLCIFLITKPHALVTNKLLRLRH